MIERLRVQMQAMQMLSKSQEVTADNLANINTPGFKGSKVFYRMFQEQVNGKSETKTVPMQQVDMKQGVLEPTGNTFDFGIKGKGFFVVKGEGNTHLSRDGRFSMNPDGYLVNSQGDKVMGQSGSIHIPEYMKATGQGEEAKLEVASDGTIRLNNEIYDKLNIVKVNDPANLERRGSNYFRAPEEALRPDSSSTVMQGYYEKGNVNPLNEMVDMMRTTKMFESQQRAITTSNEMLGQVTKKLGRV